MEEKDWNMMSNTQLQEECERLKNEYESKKEKMIQLNEDLIEISLSYCDIMDILDKRLGKNNG